MSLLFWFSKKPGVIVPFDMRSLLLSSTTTVGVGELPCYNSNGWVSAAIKKVKVKKKDKDV
jgi:hypothetical protein